MSDWYSQAAEKLRKQEVAQQPIAAHARRDQSILEQQAYRLWKQLRQWLQAEVKQLNERIGREVLTANVASNQMLDISVNLETCQRDATVMFEEGAHCVSYTATDHFTGDDVRSEAWVIKVTPQNTLAFATPGGSNGAYPPIESVSSRILNGLMGWN